MSKTVTEILKESTKDLLTEDTLKQIEGVFNESVDKKVNDKLSLQVEAALIKQDEEHAARLNVLLEKIDADHSSKFSKVVQAINETHTAKLKAVIKKYQTALNEEAKVYKESLISNISNYLELYLEKTIPQKMINEAVANTKARTMLGKLRNQLGIDFAFSKTVIKEGVADGKQKLVKAEENNSTLIKENAELKTRINKAEATILLETKTAGMPKEKKDYLTKVLCDKTPQFINENFKYTEELFEQNAEEALESLKNSATPITKTVDRPTKEEVINESVQNAEDPMVGLYLKELGR